jgi:hypothetical protein
MGQKKAIVFMIGRRRNREDLRVRTVPHGAFTPFSCATKRSSRAADENRAAEENP